MTHQHTALNYNSASRVDGKLLRTALGAFVTGITVITARGRQGEWVGLTVNSFNSVSLDPPLVLWSLSLNSPSLAVIKQATHYAVNVLSEGQQDVSQRFASSQPDKFSGLGCSVGLGGVPLLPDCCASFECRNVAQHPGGDHLILIGEVERFSHQRERAPLIYFNGGYRSLSGSGL